MESVILGMVLASGYRVAARNWWRVTGARRPLPGRGGAAPVGWVLTVQLLASAIRCCQPCGNDKDGAEAPSLSLYWARLLGLCGEWCVSFPRRFPTVLTAGSICAVATVPGPVVVGEEVRVRMSVRYR